MTQDETWLAKYEKVKDFVLKNGRNPSKYDAEERGLYGNWLKHNRKLYNADQLKPERKERFEELLRLCETYRRKNQYE